MRRLICLALFSIFAFATFQPAKAFLDKRPNVILIMSDDQGYGDFGATGNPVIQTPNIDRMASKSAMLSHFYVSPVCSPTRACLMTGRYNHRTRCIDTWIGRSMMEPDETTIAEVLATAGYRTGIFGKWHLGDCYPMRPQDQGFQVSLVHKGGGIAQPSEPLENRRRYSDSILFKNGKQIQTKGYCTDVYFDSAIEFIQDSKQSGKPFFAYIATNAPHSPFHDVPQKLLEDYKKKADELRKIMIGKQKDNPKAVDQLARIAAMITNIDNNVGKLLDALKKSGLSENTLVIFMVDNGPNSRRYVKKFRGVKNNVHEGGIRSPAWLHWPARLKPRKIHQMAAHIDIMPTILAACGVATPKGVKFDGRNLMPLLIGAKTIWPKRNIVIQTHRGNQAVKYHHFMICDGRWKLLHASGFHREKFEGSPKFELYDLRTDPGESNNQFESHSKIAQRLLKNYESWFEDVSSTRKDNYAPPRIILGQDAETQTVLTRQDWRIESNNKPRIGVWKVALKKPRRFIAEVILPQNVSSGEIELTCGQLDLRSKFSDAKNRKVTTREFKLDAGRFDFKCVIHSTKDKTHGAYQVILKRVK